MEKEANIGELAKTLGNKELILIEDKFHNTDFTVLYYIGLVIAYLKKDNNSDILSLNTRYMFSSKDIVPLT